MYFCKPAFPKHTNFAICRVFLCVFAFVCFRERAFAQQNNFAICFDKKKLCVTSLLFTYQILNIQLRYLAGSMKVPIVSERVSVRARL